MRAIVKLAVMALLLMVCAAGIPTDRSIIEAPQRGRLSIVDGGLRFSASRGFEAAQVYLLGAQIKFKEGGYLAHRAGVEPGEEIFVSATATPECNWTYDDEGIGQPRQHHNAGHRRLARIKVTDGPLAGWYLAASGPLSSDFLPSRRRTLGREYRAVLVRDREQAPIFEVRQWVIHK